MRKLLTVALTTGLLALAPAAHAVRVMPGSFTGYAFDQCLTPSQEEMDVWLEHSPYWGVGVYLAGVNRQCDVQPNLTSDWVAEQSRKGWRILPLTVGRQAACTAYPALIDDSQANSYAAAKAQGRAEAVTTVAASEAVGLPKKTTHWLDIEDFDVLDTHCRRSVLAFISGWTSKLHKL
ncbi:MAG TPA: glycoside hydrolase domain-containing protein, partial [Nocardioidaceae bacterium]|nr:glycoside hydrolase domain-containing protein [Nocardioidaceae bacterium]